MSSGQTSGGLTFRHTQRLTSPDNTAFQCPAADLRPLVQLDLRRTLHLCPDRDRYGV